MRNKRFNNNLTGSISKGGVLYRAGEIPALTKEQIEQAKLVSKLPKDFPFAQWDNMYTKQQLQQMKHSGLNDQDQWSLLNANVPLSVLNQHNQAQAEVETRASATRIAASLMSATAQASVPRTQAAVGKPTISTPLQTYGLNGQLEGKQLAVKTTVQNGLSSKDAMDQKKDKFWDKVAANPAKQNVPQPTPPPSKTPGSNTPLGTDTPTGNIWQDMYKAITTLLPGMFPTGKSAAAETKQTPAPYEFWFRTEPPTKTPRMTPSPSPTPKPTQTPTPKPSRRDQIANDVVTYAIEHLGDKYSKEGNTGSLGYDCSGLVRAACEKKGSGLIFGQGYISNSCEDGMAEDLIKNDCCDVKYDYSNGGTFPELKPGDLVFFADPGNLGTDKHVAIATGEGLQVIEASNVVHKVTDEFDAYEREDSGDYIRKSGQIVTYVLSPYYDWEEQP
jgi:cell wall-associated NlpC family hydrolase